LNQVTTFGFARVGVGTGSFDISIQADDFLRLAPAAIVNASAIQSRKDNVPASYLLARRTERTRQAIAMQYITSFISTTAALERPEIS